MQTKTDLKARNGQNRFNLNFKAILNFKTIGELKDFYKRNDIIRDYKINRFFAKIKGEKLKNHEEKLKTHDNKSKNKTIIKCEGINL